MTGASLTSTFPEPDSRHLNLGDVGDAMDWGLRVWGIAQSLGWLYRHFPRAPEPGRGRVINRLRYLITYPLALLYLVADLILFSCSGYWLGAERPRLNWLLRNFCSFVPMGGLVFTAECLAKPTKLATRLKIAFASKALEYLALVKWLSKLDPDDVGPWAVLSPLSKLLPAESVMPELESLREKWPTLRRSDSRRRFGEEMLLVWNLVQGQQTIERVTKGQADKEEMAEFWRTISSFG